jgi:23S rRNA (guanosine2251-2'-O)-methyltransferase
VPGEPSSLIVGRHAVAEALAASPRLAQELLLLASERSASLKRLHDLARQAGVKVRLVDRPRLDQLSGGAAHQGVALVMGQAPYAELVDLLDAAAEAGEGGLLVMADHLQDPHNLGAVMRSAAAAGAQGLIIPRDRACPLTPAAAKSAAGAMSLLPVCRVTNLTDALESCKEAGLWALAAQTQGAPPPWSLDLKRPLVLVLGSEEKGVGQRLLKACDMFATLPLAPGVESLNASVAAGVLLFEIVRQRATAHP